MLAGATNVQIAAGAAALTALFFLLLFLVVAMAVRSGGAARASRGPQARNEQQTNSEPEATGVALRGRKFGVSRRRGKIIVEVNPNKCARFGFCEHEAPDVFYLQSDGRFGYQGVVPVERLEQVVLAMDVCPRRAISVKVPPGAVIPKPTLTDESWGARRTIPALAQRTPDEDDDELGPRQA